jgi:hypothetical protein
MIDFATLKSLTVPEGNVKKITDESGNVLWEAPPSGVTVTITNSGVTNVPPNGSIIIEGVSYKQPQSIVVPLGTVITCSAPWTKHQIYGSYGGQIKLNGTLVADRGSGNGGGTTTYDYTVNKDVEIDINNVGSPNGVYANINITES